MGDFLYHGSAAFWSVSENCFPAVLGLWGVGMTGMDFKTCSRKPIWIGYFLCFWIFLLLIGFDILE